VANVRREGHVRVVATKGLSYAESTVDRRTWGSTLAREASSWCSRWTDTLTILLPIAAGAQWSALRGVPVGRPRTAIFSSIQRQNTKRAHARCPAEALAFVVAFRCLSRALAALAGAPSALVERATGSAGGEALPTAGAIHQQGADHRGNAFAGSISEIRSTYKMRRVLTGR
jgi:hypothetical protein